jgi:hypothetical protein
VLAIGVIIAYKLLWDTSLFHHISMCYISRFINRTRIAVSGEERAACAINSPSNYTFWTWYRSYFKGISANIEHVIHLQLQVYNVTRYWLYSNDLINKCEKARTSFASTHLHSNPKTSLYARKSANLKQVLSSVWHKTLCFSYMVGLPVVVVSFYHHHQPTTAGHRPLQCLAISLYLRLLASSSCQPSCANRHSTWLEGVLHYVYPSGKFVSFIEL